MDIESLIVKYRNNSISKEELIELRMYMDELSDEDLSFILADCWDHASRKKLDIPGFDELTDNIHRRNNHKHRSMVYYWSIVLSSAAAVLFIVLFSFYKFSIDSIDLAEAVSKLEGIDFDGRKVTLVLGKDSIVRINKGANVKNLADGNVVIEHEKGNQCLGKIDENNIRTLVVPYGLSSRMQLADGSIVYVNAGSKIVFPEKFKGKRREIYVDGEISLDVTKDAHMPFVVKTKSFEVEVLGTIFNIKAYSNSSEKPEVVLAEGKVKVLSANGHEKILKPDRKAVISENGVIDEFIVDADEYMSWTQGIMLLKDCSLKELSFRLSRFYGVEIKCDSDIANIGISGKIDVKCSIKDLLYRLTQMCNINLNEKEDSFVLESKIENN